MFFAFGMVVPVYAEEATKAASLIPQDPKSATESAVVNLLNPDIPKLRLPFDGNYPVSLKFGESYPKEVADQLGELGKEDHNGIDFEMPEGTPILAVDDGEVNLVGDGDYGITVKISHEWGTSLYGHLKKAKVNQGQKVTKGEKIALSGSTGESTGPHLHFGIKPKNPILDKLFGFIDPMPHLSDVAGVATSSAQLTKEAQEIATPASGEAQSDVMLQADNIASDAEYLFNYKFNLNKGTSVHFYDKATKRPSFAIADENYDYKLRFFLNESSDISRQSSDNVPKIEGNKVEFPVNVGGIPMTLRYTINGNQVKEEFIIEQKPTDELLANLGDQLKISFDLSTEKLSIEEKNGEYIFKSSDGKVVWRILAPTIEDNQGKKGTTDDISLKIKQSEAVLSVKAGFLKEAQYPVIIDPTWTQTDWSGGSGQTSWSDATKYSSGSSVTTSSGQFTLSSTSNWYNTSWAYRKKITFDNSAQSANLTDFPVLVKLTSSRVDYANTQNSGQDIRFTDSDGTTLLSHEIESWDESGNSFVWVKVPQINASSSTDHVYMYYGNSSVADGQAATSVWDSNYKGVWHLNEASGNALDSTSNGNTLTNNATVTYTEGQIAKSGSFASASSQFLSHVDNDSLSVDGQDFSYVTWVNATTFPNTNNGIANKDDNSNLKREWHLLYSTFSNRFVLRLQNNATNLITLSADAFGAASTATWYMVAVTYNATSRVASISVNGGVQNGGTATGDITASSGAFRIGTSWGASNPWNGKIDETRLSKTVRSASWLAAEYKSGVDTFNSFGSEEPQVTTSGSLTSSIFDTSQRSDWGAASWNVTTPSNTSVSVKVRTSDDASMTDATAFSSCSAITSGADISGNSCVTDSHRYIQYEVSLSNTDSMSTPTFQDISIVYSQTVPIAPSSLSGSASGTDRITWSWTDNSSDEDGFYVQDTSGNTKCTVSSASTTTCIETSLTPNTTYTRNVVAYNTSGNSSASSNASATTRTISLPSLDSPGDSTYTKNERPTFKFKAASDNTDTKKYTDVTSYKFTVKGPDDITYITISDIPPSRTQDYETSTYLAQYEGFSDSNITNNYISIYTKTSSSWNLTSNDGKLKAGKNIWTVSSVDAGGNAGAATRTLYADFTTPQITDLSSSDSLGEKDGYLILTRDSPTITSTITDNLALEKVELNFIKENYFLGSITSTESVLSQTYTLTSLDSATSFGLIQTASKSLGFGSFQVEVTAFDKADNRSTSVVKLKVMTSREAELLLTGKIAKDEKTSTTSILDLEKKALLRREKEAAELDKLLQALKGQLGGVFDELVQFLSYGDQAFRGMLASVSSTVKDKSDQFYYDTVSSSSNLLANIQSIWNLTYKTIEVAGNDLTFQLAYTTDSASKAVTERLSQVPIVGEVIVMAIQTTAERVYIVSINYEQSVSRQIAIEHQATNNSAEDFKNALTSLIDITSQTLETSQHKVKRKALEADNQTRINTTQSVEQLNQILEKISLSLSKSIETSEQDAKGQIAQSNKNASEKLAQVGEAAQVVWYSIRKPVIQTGDFLERVRVGAVTFQAIVLDKEPTKISDVTIEEIGGDYAVISWKTNHYATGKVNYGNDLSYGSEVFLDKRETYHKARLTGLNPGDRVFFEVMSQNGNYVYDAYYSFETLDK